MLCVCVRKSCMHENAAVLNVLLFMHALTSRQVLFRGDKELLLVKRRLLAEPEAQGGVLLCGELCGSM